MLGQDDTVGDDPLFSCIVTGWAALEPSVTQYCYDPDDTSNYIEYYVDYTPPESSGNATVASYDLGALFVDHALGNGYISNVSEHGLIYISDRRGTDCVE